MMPPNPQHLLILDAIVSRALLRRASESISDAAARVLRQRPLPGRKAGGRWAVASAIQTLPPPNNLATAARIAKRAGLA